MRTELGTKKGSDLFISMLLARWMVEWLPLPDLDSLWVPPSGVGDIRPSVALSGMVKCAIFFTTVGESG